MYADGEEGRSFDAAQRREKNNAARGVTIYKLFNGEARASLSWGGKGVAALFPPPSKVRALLFCVCVRVKEGVWVVWCLRASACNGAV